MQKKIIIAPTPSPSPPVLTKPFWSSLNVIYGTDKDDTINGTDGDDLIVAGDGADELHADAGNDWMYGGKGDDHYDVKDAGDRVYESPDEGLDTVHAWIDYTLPANVERLQLEGDAVKGTGNELNNSVFGNDANNILIGLGGNDALHGGAGADTMIGGIGDDNYDVDNVLDVVTELPDEGNDSVYASIGYTLGPNVENLYLEYGAGNINGTGNGLDNNLTGNPSDNIMKGEGGDDIFSGLGGKDTMYGGPGDDYFIIDSGDDTVIEQDGEGTDDMIFSMVSYTMPDYVEWMFLDSLNPMDGFGNNQDNTIMGNGLENLIVGNGGNDYLVGRVGKDTLLGGDGNDTLHAGDDADTITGGAGNDTFRFFLNHAHDTVTDFQIGSSNPKLMLDQDMIVLDHALFADYAAVQAAMQQVGADTVIAYDADNTITLQNVNVSSLQATHFGFI